ncbi:MAG: Gfo/Idh/MocA family oxidoreductase [Planctomycetia bacterium]|nr:Gfo/Idh/MocA family oxidoreductase [Planctomycetia bacterium]
MAKTFRVGVLGLSHDHVWDNLQQLKACGRGTLVAAWDPNPPLLDRVKQQYGCAIHGDAETLLAREQLDAVYVFGDNANGAQLAARAAGRGLHVLIEKPMAASLDGADRMLAASRDGGGRLMVNWPFAWWPQLQHALRLARGGDIGDVWQVKYRAAHAGPRELGCSPYFCDWLYDPARNGAGAFMDYCCYGAALSRCILGMPSRVTAVGGRLRKEEILAEDNGILIMTYARALALSEGSWTQIGDLTSYTTVIHGSRGTLLVEPRAGGRLLLANDDQPLGAPVEVPPAAPEMRTASDHFLNALATEQPFYDLCAARNGRDTQEILEAGLLSIAEGREVSLPLKSFLSGRTRP